MFFDYANDNVDNIMNYSSIEERTQTWHWQWQVIHENLKKYPNGKK